MPTEINWVNSSLKTSQEKKSRDFISHFLIQACVFHSMQNVDPDHRTGLIIESSCHDIGTPSKGLTTQ